MNPSGRESPPAGVRGKRAAVAAVVVPLGFLLVSVSQVFVTGTSSDPLLRSTLTATGAQVVPAVVAVLLVVAAALVGLLTGGPRGRPMAGVILAVASAGAAALVATGLANPAEALGRRAAEISGRTGSVVPVDARLTAWAVLAAVAATLMVVGAGYASWSARGWRGLGSRYEPVSTQAAADSAGPDGPDGPGGPGGRRSDWDELTHGHDPTRRDSGERT
ncbi:MAG: Trp biosynthesis-associated membrane protein [Actinomycetales bacterium]|nr:Trp biosynthesis-associated membrane protein [Actinomycetales bacterium]